MTRTTPEAQIEALHRGLIDIGTKSPLPPPAYRFLIGATRPFDEVYPRSLFEKRVARELAEERVLRRVFGHARGWRRRGNFTKPAHAPFV